MRKLMIVVALLSILGWPTTLAAVDKAATQLNSVQIAGDSGPNGG